MALPSLSDVSIRTRVVLGFAAMVAVILALGGAAIDKFAALNGGVQEMNANYVASIENLAVMRAEMLNMRVAIIRRVYVVPTPAERAAEEAKFEAAVRTYEQAEKEYLPTISGLHERALYERIKAAKAAYLGSVARLRQYLRQDNTAEAVRLSMTETAGLAGPMEAALREDLAYNVAGAKAGAEDATRTYQSGRAMVIGMVLGGVVLAILVGGLLVRTIAGPVRRMTAAMRHLADGDLAVAVPGVGRGDEVGAMAGAVQVFKDNALRARTLEQAQEAERARRAGEEARLRKQAEEAAAVEAASLVVGSIGTALERLAAGDLTYRLETALPPAYAKLRDDLNRAMEQLQASMRAIVGNAGSIRSGSGEIAQASDDLSRRTEQQAASLEQTAAALDEITATVRQTSEGAKRASEVVGRSRQDAERSEVVVRDAVAAMAEIEKSAHQISQIIGVIDEIAFQTSLLALNAGVEAARAGDAGRGFAVVASEVRALAQRSAEAAKEIKALISASTRQVDAGAKLVGETGEALSRILGQVSEVSAVVSEIAASATEQSTGLAEVNTAMNQLDQVTQQNAAMVEQSTAASRSLADDARKLSELTSRFRLGDAAAPARPVAAPSRTERHMAAAQPSPARSAARAPARGAAPGTARNGSAALKVSAEVEEQNWKEF